MIDFFMDCFFFIPRSKPLQIYRGEKKKVTHEIQSPNQKSKRLILTFGRWLCFFCFCFLRHSNKTHWFWVTITLNIVMLLWKTYSKITHECIYGMFVLISNSRTKKAIVPARKESFLCIIQIHVHTKQLSHYYFLVSVIACFLDCFVFCLSEPHSKKNNWWFTFLGRERHFSLFKKSSVKNWRAPSFETIFEHPHNYCIWLIFQIMFYFRRKKMHLSLLEKFPALGILAF